MLIDSNSIPRTERNSLSLRQLVHPGCQNAFSGAVSAMPHPYGKSGGMFARAAGGVNRGGRMAPQLWCENPTFHSICLTFK